MLAVLYYVCGYIGRKENVLVKESAEEYHTTLNVAECEFALYVSRGRLSFPTDSLFTYAKACMKVFNSVSKTTSSSYCCVNHVRKLLECVGNSYSCNFQGKLRSIAHRLANVFFKEVFKKRNKSRESKNITRDT